MLSPSNARPLHAHTFFGASVTVVPRSEAFGPEDRTEWKYDYGIYCGAPEGARCKDKDLPKHASWSFDNFGKVYQFEFQRQPNTVSECFNEAPEASVTQVTMLRTTHSRGPTAKLGLFKKSSKSRE